MILFVAWRERVYADMVKAIASIKIITFTHYGANSFYGRSDPTTDGRTNFSVEIVPRRLKVNVGGIVGALVN